MKRESGLEAEIRAYTEQLGGLCCKMTAVHRRGTTDRVCIFPNGTIVFVEVKSPTGKGLVSPQQKIMVRKLLNRGCNVWVVNSLEDYKGKVASLFSDLPDNAPSVQFKAYESVG